MAIIFAHTIVPYLVETFYTLIVIFTCIIIILDTRSVSKTLAYLVFAIFVPIVGVVFYFFFGINYRKRKLYNKKLAIDKTFKDEFFTQLAHLSNDNQLKSLLERDQSNKDISTLLANKLMGQNLVLANQDARILVNGETFYPLLLEKLKEAKTFIHIEFYIFEYDKIGNEIKDILIAKAKNGVKIRFIYDDFGSAGIRKQLVPLLISHGIEAYPFNKVRIIPFANRINYRNHRKIVIIDGLECFVGGINISDRYNNQNNNELYWRDTHLYLKGNTVLSLQTIFLSDWNFCSGQNLAVNKTLFPSFAIDASQTILAQVVAGGPDYELPNILFANNQSINSAQDEILITTPYYIPDASLQENIMLAAMRGVRVRLLVPEKGDSKLVNLAAQSYFRELLKAGVEIYQYKKGFVHAKTMVIDRKICYVGTSNLDLRSFDLNFEVNVYLYDKALSETLARVFEQDILSSSLIYIKEWRKRSQVKKLVEKICRLMSAFL